MAWFILLATLLLAVSQASVLKPPVLPLTVRNPYLSTWIKNARDVPWSEWPMFWGGQKIGMSMLASVPETNDVYPLLGRPQDSMPSEGQEDGFHLAYPLYLGAQFDASTTNFSYQIPHPENGKPAELTVSFLSPITPTSSLRQSIPASYVSISVLGDFDIDVYMDLNGDWVSGDANSKIQWFMQSIEFDDSGSLLSWQVQKEDDQTFVENGDRAEWGRLHFTGPNDANYECGHSEAIRRKFAKNSKLSNNVDDSFRNIGEDEPVFAFHKAFKLGSSENLTSGSVLFTISHIQNEVVQFASARGLTLMRPLWKSWFFSEYSLLMFHYLDFDNALRLASNYSQQVEHDAYKSGGQDYVDIVALTARQVLGATSFSGTPENPMIFLKEISSNGNTQTVDVIFPAYPFFMYTNPRWLAYLLEPLLEHQLSGQYPNKYSMHDLGAHFPNETGHGDGNDEYMPIEECGDMLIMGLSLVNSLRYGSAQEAQSTWSSLGAETLVPKSLEYSPFPIVISQGRERDVQEEPLFGLDDKWGGGTRGSTQAQKWLKKSYPIWKQWTRYLVKEALEPANQLCTDDFAGWLPLQTNLALKGIVGIKAMSELAETVGEKEDAKYYGDVASEYIRKWEDYAISRDGTHAKLSYDWYGSWTTLYSLFADAVLCFHPSSHGSSASKPSAFLAADHQKPLNPPSSSPNRSSSADFIPTAIYMNQSAHYKTVIQKFGVPLDSRHLYAKSDWLMQIAAVSPKSLRKDIVSRMARWLNENVNDRPFIDIYNTEGDGNFGDGILFMARPVSGSAGTSSSSKLPRNSSQWVPPTQKFVHPSVWSSKLKSEYLGKSSSVLVVRDAERRLKNAPLVDATYEPATSEDVHTEEILASMESQKQVPVQEEVNRSIERLRPIKTQFDDDKSPVLSKERYDALLDELIQSFDQIQLSRYVAVQDGKRLVAERERDQESAALETMKDVEQKFSTLVGEWQPQDPEYKPSKVYRGRFKSRGKTSSYILRVLWRIEIQEEIARPGVLTMKLDNARYSLLTHGGQQSILSNMARLHAVKISATRRHRAIHISSDKISCQRVARLVRESTSSIPEVTINLGQLNAYARAHRGHELERKEVEDIAGQFRCSPETRDDENNVILRSQTQLSIEQCRRALVSATRTFVGPASLKLSNQEINPSGFLWMSADNTSSGRFSSNHDLETRRNVDRSKDLLREETYNSAIRHIEDLENHAKNQCSPVYLADFGQVSFENANIQNRPSKFSALSNPELLPSFPSLPQLMIYQLGDQAPFASLGYFKVRLVPSPWVDTPQTSTLPSIEIQLRLEPESRVFELREVSFDYGARRADVVFPGRGCDVQLSRLDRRPVPEAQTNENINQYVQALSDQSQSMKPSFIPPPFLSLNVAALTSEATSLEDVSRGQPQIDFTTTYFTHSMHQVEQLRFDFHGLDLVYNQINTGDLSGNRRTLGLEIDPADPRQAQAWKDGRFLMCIREVMSTMNRRAGDWDMITARPRNVPGFRMTTGEQRPVSQPAG